MIRDGDVGWPLFIIAATFFAWMVWRVCEVITT